MPNSSHIFKITIEHVVSYFLYIRGVVPFSVVLIGLTALYLGWSGLAFSYFASFHIPLRFRSFSFMVVLHLICEYQNIYVLCSEYYKDNNITFLALLLFMLVEFIIKKFDTVGSVLRIVFMIFPGFAVTCGIQDWFIAISRRSLWYLKKFELHVFHSTCYCFVFLQ